MALIEELEAHFHPQAQLRLIDYLQQVQSLVLVLLYNKFPIKYERPCKSGKTIIHLFAPEQLGKVGKVKNASVSRLVFENGVFSLEPDIQL